MTRYKLVDVTPELAAKLLENNYETNRRINRAAVETMAHDMETGRYESQNGQTITVTSGGMLLDGQHRMSAVVKSRVTLPFLVCFVDESEAARLFRTIDSGKSRSVIQFVDVPQKGKVVALAKVAHAFENGNGTVLQALRGELNYSSSGKAALKASRTELLDYIEKNSGHLIDVVRLGSTIYEVTPRISLIGVTAAIELLHYLHADTNVRDFIVDVTSLIPSKKVSAALVRKIASFPPNGSVAREETFLAFLYAHDKWCSDEDSQMIKSTAKVKERYQTLLEIQRSIRAANDAD